MANVLVNEKTLKVIADAVRARGGTSALMKPGEIPDAVSNSVRRKWCGYVPAGSLF